MFNVDPLVLVWKRKWLVALLALAGLAVAIVYLNVAQYEYRAELRVTPADSSRTPTLANVVQTLGFSPAASLGLGGPTAATPFDVYLDSLLSRDVADELAHDPEVMRPLFAEQWDTKRKVWREPQSFAGDLMMSAKRLLGLPIRPWSQPDGAALQEYFVRNLRVINSTKIAVTRINLDDEDPRVALYVLTRLNEAADRKVRGDALKQARTYAAFLTERLRTVQLSELRQRIADQLGRQEELIMMASSGVPYAAKPLEPPTVTAKPVKPAPSLVLPLGLMAGLAFGTLAALALGLRAQSRMARRASGGPPRASGAAGEDVQHPMRS